MISQHQTTNGLHSSEVCLRLELGGKSFALSSVGPNRLVLVESRHFEDEEGQLMITVDGETRSRPIRLHFASVPTREYSYSRR